MAGGLSRLSAGLAKELDRGGHLTGVLAPRLPGAEEFDQTSAYPIHRFPGWSTGPARLIPGFLATGPFRKEILEQSDHLLATSPTFGGAYSVLAKKPFSVFAFGPEFLKFEPNKPSLGKRILFEIYDKAHSILAVSRFTRDRLVEAGVPTEKVHICPPGVDLDLFQPERVEGVARERLGVEGSGPFLLSVGKLARHRRHHLVIEAVSVLRQTWPGIEYWIAGTGPEEDRLKRWAKKLGVASHVRFWKGTAEEELVQLYQASDVFVLPAAQDGSNVEGLGMVLLEAAASGKPTIAADSGGLAEAMISGKTALLVPPDDFEALLAALEGLLGDTPKQRAMGKAGLDWVSRERNWTLSGRAIVGAIEE